MRKLTDVVPALQRVFALSDIPSFRNHISRPILNIYCIPFCVYALTRPRQTVRGVGSGQLLFPDTTNKRIKNAVPFPTMSYCPSHHVDNLLETRMWPEP